MNELEFTHVMVTMVGAWSQPRPDGWEKIWAMELGDLPYEVTLRSMRRLVRQGGDFPPSIGQVRREVASVLGLIPPDPTGIEGEEWARLARDDLYRQQEPRPAPHPVVAAAVARFGGVEAVVDDRNAWRRFWGHYREEHIRDLLVGEDLEAAALAAPPLRAIET